LWVAPRGNENLKVGFFCTRTLPLNRPSLRRVIDMPQDVNSLATTMDGKMYAYYY